MLSSYRRIFAHPGALRFSATGLVARLPMSMDTLGIVFLVTAATGSYGLAGSMSGAFLVANAVLSVPQGRWLDRYGQSRVLSAAIVVFAVAMVLMIVAVQADWPTWTAYAWAVVAGSAFPQVGASVRARWSHVLDDPAEVQTAYALEAVVDEAVFMVGPVVVTLLATGWSPVAGLGAAILAGVVGTFLFAGQRATEPPAQGHHGSAGPRPAMPWATMVPLAIVGMALGALFGAAEVTTVAFAAEHHAKSLAGVLLALWSMGSLIAGFLTGLVGWRSGPAVRLRWGAAAMACAMAPLALIDAMWLMGVVLFVAGFAIAPTLVASMSLVEQTVPPGRLTEGMVVVHTGLVAGIAPGATVAGLVIDAHGASPAYLVAVTAGVVAALAAQALPRGRRTSYELVAPTAGPDDAAT